MSDQLALGGGELGFSLQLQTCPAVVDPYCPGRTVVDGACTVCAAPADATGMLGRHRAPVAVQETLL